MYLDMSTGESFRVPRVQENLHSIAEICNTEEFLLLIVTDEALIHSSKKKGNSSSTKEDDENSSNNKSAGRGTKNSRMRRKRFSETFKMILNGDSDETLL